MRAILSLMVGAAIAMTTSIAGAQDLGGSSTPSSGGGSGGSITDTSGPTDHSLVVGHMGLRYFGTTTMSVLGGAGSGLPGYDGTQGNLTIGAPPAVAGGTGAASGSATLHTVGARYWLSGGIALEGGLSIGFSSGSTSQTRPATMGTNTVTTDVPNFFGIGLQLGVPVMLAESKHLSINLTPLLGFHYATSAITTGTDDNAADQSGRSIQFTLGANAAAELQFGFIGIPQLALQAQFGLQLRYTSATLESVPRRSQLSTSSTVNNFGLGTTLGPNYSLGDIIGGAISVIYYFGNAPTR